MSKSGDAWERHADSRARSALSKPAATHTPSELAPRTVLGGGRPLDAASRSYFEPRFGVDLSHVRIHDDRDSLSAASALHATAFTVGTDIVLPPDRARDRNLVAHELAHAISNAPIAIYREEAKQAKPSLPVGLSVPVHSRAVTGIHDWSSVHAAPNSASATNRFDVGAYSMTQISMFDANGAARVYVYYTTNKLDRNEVLAVGPDSFWYFAMVYGGGVIKPAPSNTDTPAKADAQIDPRDLAAAPDAFREAPTIYYQAPKLPRYDEKSARFAVGSDYLVEGYLRTLPGGKRVVLFYVAENRNKEFRREWVFGPQSLAAFEANPIQFLNIAWAAYPRDGEPSSWQMHSARFVTGAIQGDLERARSGLKAWKAAFTDPGWWLQLATSYASAATPKPATPGLPKPPVNPGPPQLVKIPTTTVTSTTTRVPATTAARATATPAVAVYAGPQAVGGTGVAAARVASPAPAVTPTVAPKPKPTGQPRSHLSSIPLGAKPPKGTPAVTPPAKWIVGTTSVTSTNVNLITTPAPQPQANPQNQNPKPKRPVTLWLPRAKALHLERYRSMLSQRPRVLFHSVHYDRSDPDQRNKWKQEMRPLTRDKATGHMEKRTYDAGVKFLLEHGYATDVRRAHEMMLLPNWSKFDKPPKPTDVDHVIELQVLGPSWRLLRWPNEFGNLELLDMSANRSSGTVLDDNIKAERREQANYYGNPIWTDELAGPDLVFDNVGVRGGVEAKIRWTDLEVSQGLHIEYLRKLGRRD